MSAYVLETRALAIEFATTAGGARGAGTVRAVRGASLHVAAGECLGIVGESGCGKSTLLHALARLVPVAAGDVHLDGTEGRHVDDERWRRAVQIVFQDPYSSLNPRRSVLDTVAEGLEIRRVPRSERLERAAAMLEQVGLPREFGSRLPHQLSGGQRQRVAIARALVLEPRVLLLDEPTSALDVSVQAQILNLLARLQREHGLTYVFVSHDIGVIGYLADRIAVMRAGEIVETGTVEQVLSEPDHEYTQALLAAVPRLQTAAAGDAPAEPAAARGSGDR